MESVHLYMGTGALTSRRRRIALVTQFVAAHDRELRKLPAMGFRLNQAASVPNAMISGAYLQNVSYQQLREHFGPPRPTRASRLGWLFIDEDAGVRTVLDLNKSWCAFHEPSEPVSWAVAVPRSLAREGRRASACDSFKAWVTDQVQNRTASASS